jgi:hypothetical protein
MDINEIYLLAESKDLKPIRTNTGLKCLCPAHSDSNPSLSIDSGTKGLILNCFAGCQTKNICDKLGIALKDLFYDNRNYAINEKRNNWPKFIKPKDLDLFQIGQLRNLSIEGLRLAVEREFLFICIWNCLKYWVLTDPLRSCAQIRRMDGKFIFFKDVQMKAFTLPGSKCSNPIGIKQIGKTPFIAFCEGGPDFLAAYHYVYFESRRDCAVVCMLGASHNISESVLHLFQDKIVRFYIHNDDNSAGLNGARKWINSLQPYARKIDCFCFENYKMQNGNDVRDLNDLTSICANNFESNRELWSILPN